MAGIISNVAEDVRRLKEVKAAIEDVKKSLKGIDIRVNIDIKESVEARLKSLGEQYTALVMKISEAEGKIMLSVNRINKASDAIIQAQERVSKITGGTQQPSPMVVPSNTSAETASIQAQAKAYEDLKAEINDVLGTRDANVKRMVDEMNTIRLINAEIKMLTKLQGESGTLSSTQQKRLEQLNNSLLAHKTALSDVRQVLSNNVKMDNAAATSMNELSQSLSRMRIAYRDLTEEERKSPFGKELLSSIQQADAKIKELDSSIGNHARNVGNYKKEWNGLQNQMQMVARELPNFAISPQIGIMSLTNNLPYLADELKKAKDAHKEYVTAVKAGQKDLQKVPSVGKQVLSSLFSWQTGLIMIITLITAYRQEVTEWCKGLFNAKDRLNAASEAQIRLNDAIRQGSKDAIRERTQLDLLYNKLKDTTISTKERNAAVSEWMKKNPQYTSVVNGEKTNINQLGIAYKELTRNIIASAQAKRIESLLVSGVEKQADLIGNVTNAIIARDEAQKKVNSSQSEYNKIKSKENKEILEIDKQSLNRRKKELIEAQDSLRKQTLINEDVKKNIKLDNLFPQPQKGTYDYWQQQVQIADSALKQIDSKQKVLLDNTAKDPKTDLYSLGIDKSIVDSYKSAVKAKNEAEKELKAYPSTSDTTKQESAADKLREQQEKYNLLLDKQARERKRMEEDSANELKQLEIDRLKEGSEKVLKQRALNHKKELEAIEREAQEKKAKAIEEGRTAHEANPDNKKKPFNAEDFIKSEPVKKQFATFDNVAESKTKTENTKYNRGDDLSGLLNEYQDYTDKRLAIETKFNNDLAVLDEQRKQAVKNGDTQQVEQIDRAKAQATTNKGKELMSMDYDKLKESPEYVRAFENLKETSSETLNSLLSQLENAKTAAAKVLSPDQLREYTTTIQDIMNELDERNPWQALSDKKQELADAEQELAQAQIELENARQTEDAVKGGAKVESGVSSSKYNPKTGKIDSSKAYLTEAQALDKVKAKTDNYNKSKDKVAEKSAKVKKSEKDVTDQIDELSKAISDVGNSIGGPAGEIISLIGDIGSFTMMAINGVKMAADTSAQAISTVEKASVILMIISAAIQLATKVMSFFAADYSDYNESKENYEKYVEVLDVIISKQKELIETLTGEAAVRASKDALDLIEKQAQAARNLGKERLNAGASAGSHSIGVRIKDSMSESGWNEALNAIGTGDYNKIKDGRMTGLFDLSVQQLNKLQMEAPEFWAKLDEDVREYLEQIIACNENAEELKDILNESLTGVSFDSVSENFLDALSDMDTSAADFADNFSSYMQKAILNTMMAKTYEKRLNDWYESFANANKDGDIDSLDYDKLQKDWEGIVSDALLDRDKLKDLFGWTSGESTSQDSTSGGFETMSQDTGEELNGRFTALQIAGEEIRNQSILQSQSLNLLTFKADAILAVNTEVRNIADETRTILANSYLELVQISENTGESAKYLKDIKSDIAEVKKNTKAMAG